LKLQPLPPLWILRDPWLTIPANFADGEFQRHSSLQLIGFLGKDPEKRQVRGNGASFAVLSVATQQSWKDSNDEWQSKTEWHRVVAFNRLGESLADALQKGDHVLVDGQLVSSKCERENGKSKRAKASKVDIFWSLRANSVRCSAARKAKRQRRPPHLKRRQINRHFDPR
jgi:single stranded DNA-binding protein